MQLVYQYEKTVLAALADVENAMVGYVEERSRGKSLENAVAAASKSEELVLSLYKQTIFPQLLELPQSKSS